MADYREVGNETKLKKEILAHLMQAWTAADCLKNPDIKQPIYEAIKLVSGSYILCDFILNGEVK